MKMGNTRAIAQIMALGFASGLAGCLVLGEGGAIPEDAACVVDYDECLSLGVNEEICQSIFDACAGDEGGEEGGDEGGSCWDEVNACLEEHDGDEEACQDVIEACIGGDEGGEDGGDDGGSCWDEVEWCFEADPDSPDCEALAEECLGGGDDGGDDGGGEDEGGDDGGEPCEEILEACAEPGGEISEECWHEYETCLEPPDCADDPECCEGEECCDGGECCDGEDCCELQYNQCIDDGWDPSECEWQYMECTGDPGGDGGDEGGATIEEGCETVHEHCQQSGLEVDPDCAVVANTCGDPEYYGCYVEFFEGCVGIAVEDYDVLHEFDAADLTHCYEDLTSCAG